MSVLSVGVNRCAQVPQCLSTLSTLTLAKAACLSRYEEVETCNRRRGERESSKEGKDF